MLFVVMVSGPKDETMFLTSQQITPLLDHWGIPPEDVQPISPLPPEVRAKIHERMKGIRQGERKAARTARRARREGMADESRN